MSNPIEKVKQFLTENGFKEGRYGLAQHNCGIAPESILVKPDWSPVDGDHTLAVTTDRVISMTVLIPYNNHDWQIRASWPYTSPEQLKEILDREVKTPAGCWK